MTFDKKTIIAIVLCVVAAIVVVYQFKGPKARATRLTASKTAGQATVASRTGSAESQQEEVGVSSAAKSYTELISGVNESDLDYSGPEFVNPMAPLVGGIRDDKEGSSGPASNVSLGQSEARALGYTIEGIVWDEASPLALMNGQVVGVGEQLKDGALITEITPDTVRFTIGGRQYFLVFREE